MEAEASASASDGPRIFRLYIQNHGAVAVLPELFGELNVRRMGHVLLQASNRGKLKYSHITKLLVL